MIIQTSKQTIEWDFPENTSCVGMKISGGLDSAISLYMLCKYITDEGKSISIVPITTNDWKKPYQVNFSTKVLSWMKKEFPDVEFLPHETRQLEHGENYVQGQKEHNWSVLREYHNKEQPIDFLVNGINRKPSDEDVEAFHGDGPPDDRSPGQNTWGYSPYVKSDKPWSFRPIINFDKKGVAELYEKFNLMDTLFNETRSCEHWDKEKTNNFTTHCGECWWCDERKWGFGKL